MSAVEQFRTVFSESARPPTAALAGLSDLGPRELAELGVVWRETPPNVRQRVLAMIRELAEDNVEYNFKRVYLLALHDPAPDVRVAAVEGLWEEESAEVLGRLKDLLRSDGAPEVREAAASALGRFAYRCAVGDRSPTECEQLQESLRRALLEAPDGSGLQMRVTESLAYFSEEPLLAEFIARLYREGGEEEQASALIAMGRSMDPRWRAAILQELESDSSLLRFHAIRATGEMGLKDSAPALARLLEDEDDLEVQQAVIWALGQIGTEQATRVLKSVVSNSSDELREAAEEALDEAMYAGDYE